MKNFPTQYALMAYVLVLGLVTVLNNIYPAEAASLIQRVSSSNIDLSAHDYARYRIALFLSATALLVILIPFVWRTGARLVAKNPYQSPTWGKIIVFVLLIPIAWIGYPFIGLCTNCWASNDIFYFFLTVFFFFGLQLLIEVIVLKLTHRNGS